ncbi:MAG: hypothetical protein IJG62_02690 [Synergistaceae bacterium]|nr:hypothetical protein [Synergistaceae bacterium]
MLRVLTGEVLDISENYIVLDVNGLGFEILCSQSALNLCELNKRVRLVVYLQISEAGA